MSSSKSESVQLLLPAPVKGGDLGDVVCNSDANSASRASSSSAGFFRILPRLVVSFYQCRGIHVEAMARLSQAARQHLFNMDTA